MEKKAIVFKIGNCGLANRLRALVGYQAISVLLDVPFHLCWLQNKHCDASFTDLFQNQLSLIDPVESQKLVAQNGAEEYSKAPWFHEVFTFAGVETLASRTEFFKVVHSCLGDLKPHEEVLRRADEF